MTGRTASAAAYRRTGKPNRYTYDNGGCDPYVVPPAAVMCTQVMRTLDVPAGGEAATTIVVNTTGATPVEYAVPIGGRDLRVTVV